MCWPVCFFIDIHVTNLRIYAPFGESYTMIFKNISYSVIFLKSARILNTGNDLFITSWSTWAEDNLKYNQWSAYICSVIQYPGIVYQLGKNPILKGSNFRCFVSITFNDFKALLRLFCKWWSLDYQKSLQLEWLVTKSTQSHTLGP